MGAFQAADPLGNLALVIVTVAGQAIAICQLFRAEDLALAARRLGIIARHNAGDGSTEPQMKKYNVYGMGAALVDTEIEVDDAFLGSAGIDKGVMTLVDEERQERLLELLATHLVTSRRASGGSAANSVIATRCFGGTAFYSCKVAGDENEVGVFGFDRIERIIERIVPFRLGIQHIDIGEIGDAHEGPLSRLRGRPHAMEQNARTDDH